jgi:hypothetical protein
MSTAVMSTSTLYEFGDILYNKVNISWNEYNFGIFIVKQKFYIYISVL